MKKLNLSTAFLQMMTGIMDSGVKYNATDIAVAAAILHGWNSKNWSDEGYTTSISALSWQLNARPTSVRQSLKRLTKIAVIKLKPIATESNTDENGIVIVANRTRLTISRGATFDDYKFFGAIQSINQSINQSQTTLQL